MPQRRATSETLPPCYAIVHPGLEEIAGEEIMRDLGGEVKRTTRGLVVFRVPEIGPRLLRLRTVEDVFLLAWGTDKLPESFVIDKRGNVRLFIVNKRDWASPQAASCIESLLDER